MNCLKSIFIISLLVYSTGYVNSQCGNPTFKPIVASRIVNGQIAVANSFPWMVSLRQRFFSIFVSNHLCGGSLISNRHILTAAHCVTGLRPDQILAFAGIRNLTQVSSSTPLLVESITLHPSFNMSLANRGHDIAIIKLSRNITFSSTVQPICLPTSSSQSVLNRKLVLTGWGSTNGKAGVADLSNVLRQATLTVSQSKLCSSFFPYDSSRILCAIDANTTRNNNNCHGDSGSPLQLLSNSRWFVHGISSFVPTLNNICIPSYPSYYTQVTRYLDWIRTNMKY